MFSSYAERFRRDRCRESLSPSSALFASFGEEERFQLVCFGPLVGAINKRFKIFTKVGFIRTCFAEHLLNCLQQNKTNESSINI
jgi:hypothetical protein